MASLVTHAMVGAVLGHAAKPESGVVRGFLGIAIFCSMLPDIDGIGFRMGVRYGDLWGHRGMTHSLLFAAVIAVLFAILLSDKSQTPWKLAVLLFCITASHGLLDALTDGGLGVAFFSPFNPHRYFFAFTPIVVSPIGVRRFFSVRGMQVLWTEILWIWVPMLCVAALVRWARLRDAVANPD
jgi:inner membrane protein